MKTVTKKTTTGTKTKTTTKNSINLVSVEDYNKYASRKHATVITEYLDECCESNGEEDEY